MEIDNIYNMDCLEGMKQIPDGTIDAVICDLPYGTTACAWDSVIPFDKLWAEYRRICKPNAAIVLFGSEPFSTMLRASNIERFKYDWIWEKSKASNFLSAASMPLKAHEIVSVFSFGTIQTYNPQWQYGESYNKGCRKNMKDSAYGNVQTDTYEIKNEDGKRCPRSVIYFKTAESEGSSFHPTQKPVDLLRQQLKADVMNREGTSEVEPWKLSLIDELADMLAEKMAMQAEIREQGRLLQKWDKNMNPYYESNPLYVHIKAKEQSISVWRDKLGLSNTVNPDRIKQDAKRGVDTEKDGLSNLLTQARDTMNEIPEL